MADGILKVGQIQTSSGTGTINLGASGETITSSSTMGSGMGKVIQVVNTTSTTQRTTSSSSWAASGLIVSITPVRTSSKIIIMFGSFGYQDSTGVGSIYTLYGDGSNLGDSTKGLFMYRNGGSNLEYGMSFQVYDSPSTTSAIDYEIYQKIESGSSAISYISRSNAPSYLTAMEIGE